MTAFEAGSVIGNAICRYLFNEMNSLLTSLAFLLSSDERHFSSCHWYSDQDMNKTEWFLIDKERLTKATRMLRFQQETAQVQSLLNSFRDWTSSDICWITCHPLLVIAKGRNEGRSMSGDGDLQGEWKTREENSTSFGSDADIVVLILGFTLKRKIICLNWSFTNGIHVYKL